MVSSDSGKKKERLSFPFAKVSLILSIVPVILILILFILSDYFANGEPYRGASGNAEPVFLLVSVGYGYHWDYN